MGYENDEDRAEETMRRVSSSAGRLSDRGRQATSYLSGKGKRLGFDPDESSSSGVRSGKTLNTQEPMKARDALATLKRHLAELRKMLSNPSSLSRFERKNTSAYADMLSNAVRKLENPKSKGLGRSKKSLPQGMGKKQIGRIAQAGRKSVSKAVDSVSAFLRGD